MDANDIQMIRNDTEGVVDDRNTVENDHGPDPEDCERFSGHDERGDRHGDGAV